MSMAKREIQPVDAASLVFTCLSVAKDGLGRRDVHLTGFTHLAPSHQAPGWDNHRAMGILSSGGFHGHDDSARLDHMFKKMVLGVAHLGRM